ncbi:hypothetical protein [Rubripirellula lacrimiformis]|nr:hypothetical protein [Rubripirellula lacrimiformis]
MSTLGLILYSARDGDGSSSDSVSLADASESPALGATRWIMRPVHERRDKTVTYTVMHPVYEQRTKTIRYTQLTPIRETRTKLDGITGNSSDYVVCKMVPEDKERTVDYTVCKMFPEQRTKNVSYTVTRMVREELSVD